MKLLPLSHWVTFQSDDYCSKFLEGIKKCNWIIIRCCWMPLKNEEIQFLAEIIKLEHRQCFITIFVSYWKNNIIQLIISKAVSKKITNKTFRFVLFVEAATTTSVQANPSERLKYFCLFTWLMTFNLCENEMKMLRGKLWQSWWLS